MRLLATDVDGTILPPGGRVSARTVAALAAAVAAGVEVVLVTGRPPRWLGQVVAETGLTGVAICANGAVLVDVGALGRDGHGVLRAHALEPDLVLEVADRLRRAVPGVAFGVESSTRFAAEASFPVPAGLPPVPRGRLADLVVAGPVVKLLGRGPDAAPGAAAAVDGGHPGDALLTAAREVLADLPVAPVHSGSHAPLVEIGPPGVDKATALASLTLDRGVHPDQVVAFGDMPNDVTMLRWAGCGYAMADGHPEALAAADRVAPAVSEDGVAVVVEGLLAALGAPAGSGPPVPGARA